MDTTGQNFYRDGKKHGAIGLGYTTYSWRDEEEVETFQHGLVFHTSSEDDGGFAIRDDCNKTTTLTYDNSGERLSLSNVYYISTKRGFSYDIIQKVICNFWGNVGNNWTYTYNWYYAGVFVNNSSSVPTGYREIASTHNEGIMWSYS